MVLENAQFLLHFCKSSLSAQGFGLELSLKGFKFFVDNQVFGVNGSSFIVELLELEFFFLASDFEAVCK